MVRKYINKPVWWSIYIIDVDNRGELIKGTKHTRLFYTGITQNIGRRIGDYLYRRGSGFLNTQAREARRTPVYVEYFFGTEYKAMQRERAIKKMTRERKKKLINSEKNMLERYIPKKALILQINKKPEERIAALIE